MKTKWMLLLAGGLSGLVLTAVMARSADLQPMVVKSLTGDLHIDQDVPCGDNVVVTTPVTQGRLELNPAEGFDDPAVTGGKRFTLTRASMSFGGFSAHRDCAGIGDTRNYSAVSVELGRAVSFTAVPAGTGYSFSIPRPDFLITEAAIVNDVPESNYMKPSSDVIGTIDFTTNTFTMKVVVETRVHFQGGCLGDLCIINEDDDGVLTANISGTIVLPDTDGDGIPDGRDNCPFVPNPDQKKPIGTPVITPPPNITVNSCADHKIGNASADDICNGGPVKVSNKAPTTFSVGKNVVTWTATDSLGRTSSATQIVTVVDTTPPTFTGVPPDITVNNCGPVALGLPKGVDDCAGGVTFKNNAPASFGVGPTVVTWTMIDASGNSSIEHQTVTVIDTVPPTVSCVPAGPPGGTFRASASDACDTPTIRLGTFVLADGERIKINETGHSGVTFVGFVGPDHIRHFQVGKGQAVITATDASGNVASAVCR